MTKYPDYYPEFDGTLDEREPPFATGAMKVSILESDVKFWKAQAEYWRGEVKRIAKEAVSTMPDFLPLPVSPADKGE